MALETSEEKRMPRLAEAFAAAAFLSTAVAGGAISATYPAESRMFPWIVCGILGASSLIWFIGVVKEPARRTKARATGGPRRFLSPVLVGLAATVAYTVAVILFGYFFPTLVFIPAMAALLGNRSWMLSFGITIAYVVLIYFLFVILFERPIPLW